MHRIHYHFGVVLALILVSIGFQLAAGESDFARRALGDHVFESLLKNKTIEYDDYRRHVTDFEMERYLAVL